MINCPTAVSHCVFQIVFTFMPLAVCHPGSYSQAQVSVCAVHLAEQPSSS